MGKLSFIFLLGIAVNSFSQEVKIGLPSEIYDVNQLPAKPQCVNSAQYTCGIINPQLNGITRQILDGVLPILKKPDGTIDIFYNDQEGIVKFNGTLDDPYKTIEWVHGVEEMWIESAPGVYPHGADPRDDHLYIESVYLPDPNIPDEIIGFVHLEDFNTPGHINNVANFENYKLGIAYSENGGESWVYCGHIINTFKSEKGLGLNTNFGGLDNIGGNPYVIKNDSFYIYFSEYVGPNSGDHHRIGLARASINDVVSAAEAHTVTNWNKYNIGNWSQSGLSGEASSLLPVNGLDFTHGDAVYSAETRKYYLVLTSFEYVNGNVNQLQNVLRLFESKDGIDWSWDKSYVLDTQVNLNFGTNGLFPWIGYPSITSINDDATIDGNAVGDEFYVFYAKKNQLNTGYENNDLFRVGINLLDISYLVPAIYTPLLLN